MHYSYHGEDTKMSIKHAGIAVALLVALAIPQSAECG
jgi:hypothetical protein